MFRTRFTTAATRMFVRWQERAEGRAALWTLDDRMLRDIGVDQATAAQEAAKPFWRP